MTTFFSVFAGLFVIYIVLDWGMDITGRKSQDRNREAQDVGRINDQSITYTDFSTLVRQAADNQKQQTGVEPDENQIRLIRDQVWNQVVDQQLYDAEIERLGISVPDKEILDWVTGDTPPDYLRQQFTDSTGKFDRERYDATLRDPRNKPIMVRVEDALRKQRQREKLQSLVLASVQVPEGDVLRRFTDQNIKYEGDFVLIDPNVLVKDEDVNVTDDDLRRFYNDHAEEFKTEATRKLKYVVFPEVASKSDTESVLSDLADIARRANEGADFSELAKTYSETPVSDVFMKHGELSPEKEKAIFAAKAGQVIGPLKEADGFHLIKVSEFRDGTTEYIHAAHVLINVENNDSVGAMKKARDVAAKARSGANFSQLAAQFSQEPGAAERGGDLGWFGKGRMVKPFEDAAFKANAGQIVGPVRTQFGYHVIKVEAKDKREVKIVDIKMPVHVSLQTKNEMTQNAEDVAFAAKESDLLKVVAEKKLTLGETPAFQKNSPIPAIGQNSAVNKFAFSNKVGHVSPVLGIQTGSGVFMVSEVKEAGIRPFEEVKASLDVRVKREKKIEKAKTIADQLRQSLAPADDLSKLTQQNPQYSVTHMNSFTLGGGIPGAGRDLGLMGAIESLPVNQISKAIEGQRGVYLIRLISKSAFDSTTYNAQRDLLRNQLLTEKRNLFLGNWSDNLKKSAEIVDNRDQFFR